MRAPEMRAPEMRAIETVETGADTLADENLPLPLAAESVPLPQVALETLPAAALHAQSGPIRQGGPYRDQPQIPAPRPSGQDRGGHDRGGQRHRGRHHDNDDDKPVLGMGDHVPAFLMRSIRTTTGR